MSTKPYSDITLNKSNTGYNVRCNDLIVDGDTNLQNLTVEDLTVNGNLDVNTMSLLGAPQLPDHTLGTDALGNLAWLNLSLIKEIPISIFYGDSLQNYNLGPAQYVEFNSPAYFDNIGVTWNNISKTLELPIDQRFIILAGVGALASASNITFDMDFDGISIASQNMAPTSTNITLSGMCQTSLGNTNVRILATRVGADTTVKQAPNNRSTWIMFIRIA